MAEVVIRRATPADADDFVETMWSVGGEGWIATEPPFDRVERADRFREFCADDTKANLVAEIDGVAIGNLGLHPSGDGLLGLGMTIREGFRGQGIGSALMEATLEWARSTEAHKIELQVWPDNERAIALYEKFGFEREGYLRSHYRRKDGSLRDAVVMGLLLNSE